MSKVKIKKEEVRDIILTNVASMGLFGPENREQTVDAGLEKYGDLIYKNEFFTVKRTKNPGP